MTLTDLEFGERQNMFLKSDHSELRSQCIAFSRDLVYQGILDEEDLLASQEVGWTPTDGHQCPYGPSFRIVVSSKEAGLWK